MRFPLLYIIVLLSLLYACNSSQENHKEHEAHEQHGKKTYTCPMHPEIVRDQPGQCPICGMNLVERIAEGESVQDTGLGFLLKPTNQFVLSQIKTITAERKELPIEFSATGNIDYDTRFVNTVSSRVSGRIDKLYIKYRFQPVSKGDKLMDIYSKDLVTEQGNYLFLLKNDPENQSMITAVENKLALMGLTTEQIEEVKSSGKTFQSVTVYSPYNGHLHDVSAAPMTGMNIGNEISQSLSIQEGMHVAKGQTVFNIYSTDRVWAVLNIHADRQGVLKRDQKVKLHIYGVNDTIRANIDFIEPLIRRDQKTITVRVPLSNPKEEIKIGAIVKALVISEKAKGLYVPASAVLSLGLNNVVFVKTGGLFEAILVETGVRTNGWFEIISGLNNTDEIAENAQLLVDSESFVKTTKL